MNLNKFFMAVLVAVSMQSCVAGAPAYGQQSAPLTREETYDAIARDLSKIMDLLPQAQSSEGVVKVSPSGGGHGTGTYIGNGRFLTAAHVVTGSEGGTLTDYRGAKLPYTVVIINEANDVAVVQANPLDVQLPARTISCRVPAIGEEVEFIGHPLRWTYVHSWGRIASRTIDVPGFAASALWITAPVGAGQSGSAVLDKDGNIVGIVNAGMSDSTGFTGYMLSVPGAAICGVLAIS
jgi:serine protease Do